MSDEAVLALADAIGALDTAVQDLDDPDALTRLLRCLDWTRDEPRGAYQQLAVVIDGLKSRLAEKIRSEGLLDVEGVGRVKFSLKDASEKWDGPRLARVIAAEVADERDVTEDGEIIPRPPALVAQATAQAIVQCAGLDAPSKSWRKGDLKARGLDPAEFTERSGGRPSVRWE